MGDTFLGNPSSIRTTFQTLTSKDLYSKDVQWACFKKTPFMSAIGVEGFGVEAMRDLQTFGQATPTGRMIRIDSGAYAFSGSIFSTVGTSFFTGRMGTMNPELVEGGNEYIYSWHEMDAARYIPVNDVDDNGKGDIDIQTLREQEMKQQYVQDFNYVVLGHASAPQSGTYGPSTVYSDLPNLISVTQTRTVGGIATTNSFWQNGVKAITTIGGGGEHDRPILLRRSLIDAYHDQTTFAETDSAAYLYVATQGAFQIYQRLMLADAIQSGNSGAFGGTAAYDAVGIDHLVFNKRPMVWDPAVTVPYGATASTEAIYGIHIPSFCLALRSEKNFKFSGWETPRVHDTLETKVCKLQTRFTPAVTARRSHFVAYDIPACTD